MEGLAWRQTHLGSNLGLWLPGYSAFIPTVGLGVHICKQQWFLRLLPESNLGEAPIHGEHPNNQISKSWETDFVKRGIQYSLRMGHEVGGHLSGTLQGGVSREWLTVECGPWPASSAPATPTRLVLC